MVTKQPWKVRASHVGKNGHMVLRACHFALDTYLPMKLALEAQGEAVSKYFLQIAKGIRVSFVVVVVVTGGIFFWRFAVREMCNSPAVRVHPLAHPEFRSTFDPKRFAQLVPIGGSSLLGSLASSGTVPGSWGSQGASNFGTAFLCPSGKNEVGAILVASKTQFGWFFVVGEYPMLAQLFFGRLSSCWLLPFWNASRC